MVRKSETRSKVKSLEDWFYGKPPVTRALFDHFVREYQRIGNVTTRGAKSMIVMTTPRKGIAYVVPKKQAIDVVFPFKEGYPDNLCFHKIAKVPIGPPQFNHHLRIQRMEDVNDEVKKFMRLAYLKGC